MLTNITIRPIEPSDYLDYKSIRTEMVHLHPHNFDVDLNKLRPLTDEQWRRDVESSARRTDKHMAYDDDKCIGMIGYNIEDTIMTIGSFYIKADYRGGGLGAQLLDKCLDDAVRKKCSKVMLWVSEQNPDVAAWYKRVGFRSLTPPLYKQFKSQPIREECLVLS